MSSNNSRWRARNRNRRRRYGAKQRRQNKQKKPVETPKPPIPNRLLEIQRKIWNAMGVASCMEFASDSMLAETPDKPDMQHSAAALHCILADLCQPIEEVIEELGGVKEEANE